MTTIVLIVVFLLAALFGYFVMGRVDRFLDEHVKGEEDEDERKDEGDG